MIKKSMLNTAGAIGKSKIKIVYILSLIRQTILSSYTNFRQWVKNKGAIKKNSFL